MSTECGVTIFVVSDSIGETAEQVVKAAASQFQNGRPEIRRVPYVEDKRSIEMILAEASRCKRAMIIYTLIVPELRELLRSQAESMKLVAVDIMGPVMDALAQVCSVEPKLEPGLIRRLDAEYFQRIEALEFAVKYDDGKDSKGIVQAGVVLVGVSRSSKTPVSMYLAHRGHKVANVPIIPEIDPPDELFELPAGKVVGLTVEPGKLLEIRHERLKSIGLERGSNYASLDRIHKELDFARTVFSKLRCQVINVTHKAVEETANMVLEIMKKGEAR